MRHFFLILLIASLVVRCKKDSNPSKDTKLHHLQFELTGFKQEISPIDQARSNFETSAVPGIGSIFDNDPSRPINHIYLFLYKNEILFKEIHEMRTSSDFGKITDTIEEGTYRMIFLASIDTLKFNKLDKLLLFQTPGTDVFYRAFDLSVSGNINKTITLNRIVSLLQIKIEDPVPTSVKQILIQPFRSQRFATIDNQFNLQYGNSVRNEESKYDVYKILRTDNYGKPLTLNVYLGGIAVNDNISLTLAAYDLVGDPIARVNLGSIPMKLGYRTTISGTLFDKQTNNNGFMIAVPNTEWIDSGPVINY